MAKASFCTSTSSSAQIVNSILEQENIPCGDITLIGKVPNGLKIHGWIMCHNSTHILSADAMEQ